MGGRCQRARAAVSSPFAGLTGLANFLSSRSAAARIMTSAHIVLIGDSTLDNASYVPRGEDVLTLLRHQLPAGAGATLLAWDGAKIADVERQLQQIPAEASHLVVSVGGNDALLHAGIFDEPAASMAAALGRLAGIREEFEAAYSNMIEGVLRHGLPTAIATIYDAAFPDPQLRRLAKPALAVLNDCITREAAIRGVPLIDLRTIFSSDADYANPIEPSAQGGRKLASAIVELVSAHDFTRRGSEIFGPAAAGTLWP